MIPASARSLVLSILILVAAGAAGEPRLWFVDNSRAGGDGSFARPFDTLEAAQAASAPGDAIFVFRGARPYGAIALKEKQALIGEGISLASIAAARGFAVPAIGATTAAPPRIATEDGVAVTLASGTALYGFAISSAKGRAVVIPGATGAVGIEQTTIDTMSGIALEVNGGDAAITIDASPIRAASGAALVVAERSGGSLDLRNASTVVVSAGTVDAISLMKNKGRITFAAPIALKTSGATALRIAAAGSVTMSAAGSVLESKGSPALDASGTAIELLFESISADGGARGISLADTTGSLRVTGQTGRPASGGTIRNTTSRAVSVAGRTAITLENMLLQKNATSNAASGLDCSRMHGEAAPRCNAAIHLTGATATLNHVTIDGSGQLAIFGDRTRGLAMTGVDIGGAGDEAGENAIQLRHPTGEIALTKSRVRASAARHFSLLTREGEVTLAIRETSFTATKKPHGQQGILVDAGGRAVANLIVGNASFDDHESFAIHLVISDSAKASAEITKSTFARQAGAIALQTAHAAALRYRIEENAITWARGPAVNINAGATGATATGTIVRNTIGEPGKPGSGARCGTCAGIALHAPKGGRLEADVHGNTIQQVDGSGIYASAGGVATMRLIFARNTIREPFGEAPLSAVVIDAGVTPADTVRLCADLSENAISGAWDPQGERASILMMINAGGVRASLPAFTGSGADAVSRYLAARNRGAVAKVFSPDPSANPFESVSTCAAK